jgi:hypothetical protein
MFSSHRLQWADASAMLCLIRDNTVWNRLRSRHAASVDLNLAHYASSFLPGDEATRIGVSRICRVAELFCIPHHSVAHPRDEFYFQAARGASDRNGAFFNA